MLTKFQNDNDILKHFLKESKFRVESIQLFAKKNGEVKLLEIYFIQLKQNQRALFCIYKDQEGFQIEILSACQVGNIIIRLNSENFSKFFLCLDILLLTYSHESTPSEVKKNAEIFPNILEYS